MVYIKILKYSAGIVLIVLGIVGLFLPIVPGILLILAGLVLMEIKIDYLKKIYKRMIKRIRF